MAQKVIVLKLVVHSEFPTFASVEKGRFFAKA
jgi:hypothetical protein